MGFLHRFFTDVFQQAPAFQPSPSSFAKVSQNAFAAHLDVDRYGQFQLTGAVRPSLDLKVRPRQGYRHDVYHDDESNTDVPVILAAASREILFPLFIQLVERLGSEVDVVLETSHDHDSAGHIDFYREHIDTPVLTSTLWEYEELLLHDGCAGVAVLNPQTPQEIQFDEHKLLIIYGSPLEPFEHLLEQNGVPCDESIKFITEAEHVHSSNQGFRMQFHRLRTELGIDADYGPTSLC